MPNYKIHGEEQAQNLAMSGQNVKMLSFEILSMNVHCCLFFQLFGYILCFLAQLYQDRKYQQKNSKSITSQMRFDTPFNEVEQFVNSKSQSVLFSYKKSGSHLLRVKHVCMVTLQYLVLFVSTAQRIGHSPAHQLIQQCNQFFLTVIENIRSIIKVSNYAEIKQKSAKPIALRTSASKYYFTANQYEKKCLIIQMTNIMLFRIGDPVQVWTG